MNRVVVALLPLPLLAGCSEPLRANGEVPSGQIPMYGNVERPPLLKSAHERFIRESTAAFGNRETASDAFARREWQLYKQDSLRQAQARRGPRATETLITASEGRAGPVGRARARRIRF